MSFEIQKKREVSIPKSVKNEDGSYENGGARKRDSEKLARLLQRLLDHYGSQNWWPAHSRMEMIVGAVLVQNTAWNNAELALKNLRRAKKLSMGALRLVTRDELEMLVRPSGVFRQKAERIKRFVAHVDERYGGSLTRMFARPLEELRAELLTLHGFGPETVDSILLYAGQKPVFIVDAYARRVLERHGLALPKEPYEAIRARVEEAAKKLRAPGKAGEAMHRATRLSRAKKSPLAITLNELHAVFVRAGIDLAAKRGIVGSGLWDD